MRISWEGMRILSQGRIIVSWLFLFCLCIPFLTRLLGTQGRSWRLNQARFLKIRNGGHRKAFLPRGPMGPCLVTASVDLSSPFVPRVLCSIIMYAPWEQSLFLSYFLLIIPLWMKEDSPEFACQHMWLTFLFSKTVKFRIYLEGFAICEEIMWSQFQWIGNIYYSQRTDRKIAKT